VNLITWLVGITMLLAFLGVLMWWIKALPLVILVVSVILLVVYDFVRTLRQGNKPG
jgi:hypothetical protein